MDVVGPHHRGFISVVICGRSAIAETIRAVGGGRSAVKTVQADGVCLGCAAVRGYGEDDEVRGATGSRGRVKRVFRRIHAVGGAGGSQVDIPVALDIARGRTHWKSKNRIAQAELKVAAGTKLAEAALRFELVEFTPAHSCAGVAARGFKDVGCSELREDDVACGPVGDFW